MNDFKLEDRVLVRWRGCGTLKGKLCGIVVFFEGHRGTWIVVLDEPINNEASAYHGHSALFVDENLLEIDA